MKDLLKYNNKELLETLWNSDLQAFMILRSCKSLHDARDKLMKHVNSIERHLYNIYSVISRFAEKYLYMNVTNSVR